MAKKKKSGQLAITFKKRPAPRKAAAKKSAKRQPSLAQLTARLEKLEKKEKKERKQLTKATRTAKTYKKKAAKVRRIAKAPRRRKKK